MADMSIAVLVGRLTRDAELKYTNSGTAICKFGLAVSVRQKKGDQWVDEPNFYNIVVWGKDGERLNQYLTKGKLVAVEGNLRQDKWEQDGVQRMAVEVSANSVALLGGGQRDGGSAESGESRYQGAPAQGSGQVGYRDERPAQSRQGQAPRQAPPQDDFPDDIPF
ncbi:MAG: single-stranded DNA-binding protein [Spirochaetales bacterium]|nr:single-stranded DNA-binding protein [Spirochaetales bacterium]